MTIKNHPCGEKNLLLIWSYGGEFESDISMSLSNGSIGANAPAVAFGKTAALEGV